MLGCDFPLLEFFFLFSSFFFVSFLSAFTSLVSFTALSALTALSAFTLGALCACAFLVFFSSLLASTFYLLHALI